MKIEPCQINNVPGWKASNISGARCYTCKDGKQRAITDYYVQKSKEVNPS